MLDAVNANTATIAEGCAARIIASYNQKLAQASAQANAASAAVSTTTKPAARASVTPRLTLLYNPGLKSSWFITTGMIGLLLVLQGSVVSSASLVREKDVGTIEQLLM